MKFKIYKIREIGLDFGDAPFGTALKTKDYTEKGIPVVQGRNIKENRFIWNNKLYVSEEKFNSLPRSHCREGDLAFPKVGTIGCAAIMPKIEGHSIYLLSTNMMKMSIREDIADIKYVYYYFCQKTVRDYIRSIAGGSSQPIFNFTTLKSLEIALPSLHIQRKIAGILSAYDDLIENNTRRIQMLEEMAQRIYLEWFVNFRYPGFEENKLIKSELGMIPEGWDVKTVSAAVEINPRISVPRDTNKPYVPMSGLNKNTMLITEYEIRKGNSGSKFQNKDVLIARITPSLEHGKTAYVQFLANDSSVAIGSTEFIVMRSKSLNSYFVYCLARNENLREHAVKSMVGASGRQRVQMECFDSFLFAHPDNDSLIKFSFIAEPIFKLIQRLWDGIQTLRKIRDFILPKLISGKIDLSELNIDIGEMDESLLQRC